MSQSRKKRRRGQLGQAAVETAIVMPLFVFLLLGIIQLSLMHQARSMTKYAAFRAARAGILNSADADKMKEAAFQAVEPLIRQGTNGNKHVEVVICAPVRSTAQGAISKQRGEHTNLSFDDPMAPGVDFEARKLAVQVTFFYPLFIPFADMLIFLISQGQDAAHEALFKDVARMSPEDAGIRKPKVGQSKLQELAGGGTRYIVPIRANYALRMQSDVPLSRLPGTDACIRL